MGVVLAFKRKHVLDPQKFRIGDTIKASLIGAGLITGVSDAGYPQVNEVAVAWLIRSDGAIFDPHGHTKKPDFNEEQWYVTR